VSTDIKGMEAIANKKERQAHEEVNDPNGLRVEERGEERRAKPGRLGLL
jgi:hypothetical protein